MLNSKVTNFAGFGWGVAFLFASITAIYACIFFEGDNMNYRLWYYTPSAAVAGSLLIDRIKSSKDSMIHRVSDGIVVLLCLCRPFFGWPAASGHAVLFVYSVMTGSSASTKIFSVFLGVVTLYAKIWLWNWDASLWPGLILGALFGLTYRYKNVEAAGQSTTAE